MVSRLQSESGEFREDHMKRHVAPWAMALALAALPAAAETAPGEIAFDGGAVAASL